MAHSLTRRVAGALLTPIATAVGYFGWLGWHEEKREGPDGGATGPYTTWQVLGFVVTLVAIAVAATWWSETIWIAPVMTTAATTAYFSVDAATSAENDGLWPIGAALLMMGTALGLGLVSVVARAVQRRSS
ncbi:MAG TPA: hypothetical protein VFU43_02235 [Streptosporangiaceae bacterium]|nr:hypothetical protein [Streptosporangiaceae bacterium]